MAKEQEAARISDAEWKRKYIDRVKKDVGYEKAAQLADKFVKKRDIKDKLFV